MAYPTNAEGVGTTAQVIVGVFENASDAHQAVTQLRASGFTSQQIGAAFRNSMAGSANNQSLATGSATGTEHESWWEKLKDAFRPDDHEEGVSAASAATDYGLESYGRGDHEYDFASEDLQGSLTEAGIPAARASYLSRSLSPGGAIVTVRDAARQEDAETILSKNGARVRYEDTTGGEFAGAGLPFADRSAAQGSAGTGALEEASTFAGLPVGADPDSALAEASNTAKDRVQLFGEVLRVHKDRVSRGEVRIRKDVITENQTIEVPVTREELTLERVPVSGNTPAPSANIGRDQEIRVPLSEETVRVEKQPVIREEVIVGKRDISDVATVSDDVRHEELRVDSDVDTPRRSVTGEELTDDARRRG